MEFDIFQTDTATLKKITLDGTGSESVADSFQVDCSVEWERTIITNSDGEEVTANGQVFITPHDKIDTAHHRWDFDFEGQTYKVEQLGRVANIGSSTISHYEAIIL